VSMTERQVIVDWLRSQGPPRSDAAYWAAIFADGIESECHIRAAQVGTHPKGGDAKQAPGASLSDAVPEGNAPSPSSPSSPTPTSTEGE
jgi:hypothetical protein